MVECLDEIIARCKDEPGFDAVKALDVVEHCMLPIGLSLQVVDAKETIVDSDSDKTVVGDVDSDETLVEDYDSDTTLVGSDDELEDAPKPQSHKENDWELGKKPQGPQNHKTCRPPADLKQSSAFGRITRALSRTASSIFGRRPRNLDVLL
jgi:hypothetical protein